MIITSALQPRQAMSTVSKKPEVQAHVRGWNAACDILAELESEAKVLLWGYYSQLTVRKVNGVRHLHYVSQGQDLYFDPKSWSIGKIIWIKTDSAPSTPARKWLSENGTDLVILNLTGDDETESELLKWSQPSYDMQSRLSTKQKISFMKGVIQEKIFMHANNLYANAKLFHSDIPELSAMYVYGQLKEVCKRMDTKKYATMEELRTEESQAAILYFAAWAGLKFKWSELDKEKARENGWNAYIGRSDHAGERNEHARTPINACLNLMNHILAGRIKRVILANGLSPYAGLMHTDKRDETDEDKFPLVFDLIEIFRGKLEKALVEFFSTQTIYASWFEVVDSNTGHVKCEPIMLQILTLLTEASVKDIEIVELVSEYKEYLKKCRGRIKSMNQEELLEWARDIQLQMVSQDTPKSSSKPRQRPLFKKAS